MFKTGICRKLKKYVYINTETRKNKYPLNSFLFKNNQTCDGVAHLQFLNKILNGEPWYVPIRVLFVSVLHSESSQDTIFTFIFITFLCELLHHGVWSVRHFAREGHTMLCTDLIYIHIALTGNIE